MRPVSPPAWISFGGILFHVHAIDAQRSLLAIHPVVEPAADRQRLVVLG